MKPGTVYYVVLTDSFVVLVTASVFTGADKSQEVKPIVNEEVLRKFCQMATEIVAWAFTETEHIFKAVFSTAGAHCMPCTFC